MDLPKHLLHLKVGERLFSHSLGTLLNVPSSKFLPVSPSTVPGVVVRSISDPHHTSVSFEPLESQRVIIGHYCT